MRPRVVEVGWSVRWTGAPRCFRCENEVGQYAALRAGFGIGVCQVALAKRDRLVRVLPDALEFDFGVWVVMHRDLKTHRRVRLMFDHLVRHLQAHLASELD